MIDRDRNTLYEGDVVEDAAGQLWLVRNDGLKRRGDWLPIGCCPIFALIAICDKHAPTKNRNQKGG